MNVTGWRQIQSNTTYTLYVDESIRLCQIRAHRTNITIVPGDSFSYDDFKIPSSYRPKQVSLCHIYRTEYGILSYVFANGTVGIYNTGSQKTGWDMSFIHEWHY